MFKRTRRERATDKTENAPDSRKTPEASILPGISFDDSITFNILQRKHLIFYLIFNILQRKPTICSIWLQAGPSRGLLPFAAFMPDLNLYGQRGGRRGRHVLQKGESIPPSPSDAFGHITFKWSVLSTLNVEDEYVAFCF